MDSSRRVQYSASFKSPLPFNSFYYQAPSFSDMDTLKGHTQNLSISDDDLQHFYLNDNRAHLSQGSISLDRSTSFTPSSEPSPQFAPSSMGSAPMTTSYSMSPPSTGMPEESLPLTPYTFPSLFPGQQQDPISDNSFSPSVNTTTNFHSQNIPSQHDNVLDNYHLQHPYASFNFSSLSSPHMSTNLTTGFNPMSAPADLSSGHGLLHSDASLLSAFDMGTQSLGLKVEDDDDIHRHHSQSLSPNMFGMGTIRGAPGIFGEEESQFSMDMDEDGMGGGSPATLYAPQSLAHTSPLDTRTIRYHRMPNSSQMGVFNADGQLIPCPSSAPPLSSVFPNEPSSLYSESSLQGSPSPTLAPAGDKRRPRRASHHQGADDADYLEPSSGPRRPRMRGAISVPGSLPGRVPRPSLSSSASTGLPSIGPNEMVITASLPVRRGRANTLFGGRAPRSVVPTPVPNLTKKSRGRRVPVARPLDIDEVAASMDNSALPTRRSSRVSATPTSATDKENDDDEGLSGEGDDDDDEFPSPSKPKNAKSKMSPRMQALVDEAIARGCSTTASGKARIFTCPVESCQKCFARGEHLKRHVRSIHTEEKPFECDQPGCGKKFSRHDNLKQHKRVHKDKLVASGSVGPKLDVGLLQFGLEALDD